MENDRLVHDLSFLDEIFAFEIERVPNRSCEENHQEHPTGTEERCENAENTNQRHARIFETVEYCVFGFDLFYFSDLGCGGIFASYRRWWCWRYGRHALPSLR